MKIAVIGAGVVGMASALRLQSEGHTVTVFDPRPPGTACSYGNSGGIGIGLIAPIAMPGIGLQAPGLLLDPDAPLFISPSHLIRKAPWFYRFWRSSRPSEVSRIAGIRAQLNHAALDTLLPLLKLSNSSDLLEHKGMLFVFEGRDVPDGAKMRFGLGERHGIEARVMSLEALRNLLPNLSNDIGTGVLIPGNWHCTNPGELVARFGEALLKAGGRIMPEKVIHVLMGEHPELRTDYSLQSFDKVVLAAGVWSRGLARQLGAKVLMEAERGYHLMLPNAKVDMLMPTTLSDRNIVMTPMQEGLRITGITEFAEPEAQPYWNRAERLLRQARRYFPKIDGTNASYWVGPRPSTPDSLPVIGPAPRSRDVIFAFGHGQSGLAHASVTADLVSDLVAERPTRMDISDFSPMRFQRA